jgi:hypothetical protein
VSTLFGFQVTSKDDAWEVSLPHECGRWMVAGDVNYEEYVDHYKAVQEMEQFVDEAQQALAALRNRQEIK